jgi:hypothetical protein
VVSLIDGQVADDHVMQPTGATPGELIQVRVGETTP